MDDCFIADAHSLGVFRKYTTQSTLLVVIIMKLLVVFETLHSPARTEDKVRYF